MTEIERFMREVKRVAIWNMANETPENTMWEIRQLIAEKPLPVRYKSKKRKKKMNELELFLREAKKIALDNMLNGTPDKIRSEVELLRRKMNISKRAGRAAAAEVKQATAELETAFVKKFSGGYTDSVVSTVLSAEKAIAATIQSAVRGLKGATDDEIREVLKRTADVQEQHVRAVVETTNAGLRRGQAIADAQAAGAEKFKFVGRAGVRPYWTNYGNTIMTIEEISKTSNGQNLDPLFYGCGWRCSHRWMAIFD